MFFLENGVLVLKKVKKGFMRLNKKASGFSNHPSFTG